MASTSAVTAAAVVEAMRGRTRDRIVRNAAKPNRSEETSTLRGRSRQRALSPRDADAAAAASRNPSPSLMSPTRHRLIHNQLRERRRNHCPSRAASPSGRRPSVSRGHRRTQSPRGRGSRVRDAEPSRPAESLSSLRNEVFVEEERAPVSAAEKTPSS